MNGLSPDKLAIARTGVASRRRAVIGVLAGTIALLSSAARRESDARDKRKTCNTIADQTRRKQCITKRKSRSHTTSVPLADPWSAGAWIEQYLASIGHNDSSAAMTVSRSLSDVSNRDGGALPRQSENTPPKRKRRDSQQTQERDRAHAARKRVDGNREKNDNSAHTDRIINATSRDETTNEATENVAPISPATKTLLWTTLFPTNLTQENLEKIAFSHFSGFQMDNSHSGEFDDFQNGGVSRMKPGRYKQLIKNVSAAASYAQDFGMDSLFIRLNSADFDVFNQEDVDKMIQATRAQAAFARQAGLAGIWFDAEDYGKSNIWHQAQDPRKQAYGRREDEVREEYYASGKQFMQSIVVEYPEAEVLLSPSIHISTVGDHTKNLIDFYRGMASVKNQRGVVIATELSYDHSSEEDLRKVFADEEQHLDDNSSVALGYWARNEMQETINTIADAVTVGRRLSQKYNWVYDESGIFVQNAPHRCFWGGWSPDHSCLAKPLQELLPPL